MFVLREKLLCPGEPLHLAAAVSGGADSMALLRILLALLPEFGLVLYRHVNHGLRGETADRDEAFVRAECARPGVPLRVFHAAERPSMAGVASRSRRRTYPTRVTKLRASERCSLTAHGSHSTDRGRGVRLDDG